MIYFLNFLISILIHIIIRIQLKILFILGRKKLLNFFPINVQVKKIFKKYHLIFL